MRENFSGERVRECMRFSRGSVGLHVGHLLEGQDKVSRDRGGDQNTGAQPGSSQKSCSPRSLLWHPQKCAGEIWPPVCISQSRENSFHLDPRAALSPLPLVFSLLAFPSESERATGESGSGEQGTEEYPAEPALLSQAVCGEGRVCCRTRRGP